MTSIFKRKLGHHSDVITAIKVAGHPIKGPQDLDVLMERIGDARIVMLGEASHGTHEYYTWRSHLSKRLITEKQFHFIAVEGDWPDAYRLNRYIKNYCPGEVTIKDILTSFDRWPTWMWANWEVGAFAEWLKKYNASFPPDRKVGFYGLDVYSLWDSLDAILKYLKEKDPSAVPQAEKAFRCFEPYKAGDGSGYALASSMVSRSCEPDVLKLLTDIEQRIPKFADDYENAFSTQQNAFVAVNAEKYYRSMIGGMAASWNIRDNHMFETLLRLLDFHGPEARVIVWAHNTHIGDARATDMADEGMYNLGELAKTHFANEEVVLVGFGSYKGSVIASTRWGGETEVMRVPEAVKDSWECSLHDAGDGDRLVIMEDLKETAAFKNRIGHRAIGVVYQPSMERYGNYVPSILPERYDAFIYLEETKALHAVNVNLTSSQLPDTFPFGV